MLLKLFYAMVTLKLIMLVFTVIQLVLLKSCILHIVYLPCASISLHGWGGHTLSLIHI